MGFFKKLKNSLGVGRVDVRLDLPGVISQDADDLHGMVSIDSLQDLVVEKVTIEIEETVETTRLEPSDQYFREEKTRDTHSLGTTEIGQNITLKSGENKNIVFKARIINPRFPPAPSGQSFPNQKPPKTSFKATARVKFAGVTLEHRVSKSFKME
jgi:hypothetical protein